MLPRYPSFAWWGVRRDRSCLGKKAAEWVWGSPATGRRGSKGRDRGVKTTRGFGSEEAPSEVRAEERWAGERARFRFFGVEQPLGLFVSHLHESFVPATFVDRVAAYRVPELTAQLMFVVEEGRAFPFGTRLGGGRHASLFLQLPHLDMLSIPATLREAVGASLRPEGLRLVLPRGRHALGADGCTSLTRLWGAEGQELLEQLCDEPSSRRRVALLEATLTRRALRLGEPHPTICHARALVESARGDISVDDLASRCGVTTRTLHTLFSHELGLTPKQAARVVRVRRALELVQAAVAPLHRISAASAFADPAHLSREFRSLLGTTPRALSQRIRTRDATPLRYTTDRELLSTGLLLVPREEDTSPRNTHRDRGDCEAGPTPA